MNIKYWINRREPEAQKFADLMRKAGIDFGSAPTSGPLLLRIDGSPHYGPINIKYAIDKMILRK